MGRGRRRCRTGLMPDVEMPHLPLKQFNPRSLSASSVSSFPHSSLGWQVRRCSWVYLNQGHTRTTMDQELGRRTCRTGLMPGAEMPHLPLKQFNSRSLSASSVSSFFPQFAGLTGASLLMGLI